MDIKIIRLITGEDLLCEMIETGTQTGSASEVTVKNPVRIVVMPSKTDPKVPSIGLAPWCEFSESKVVSLRWDHIIFCVDPVNEFKNQYQSMFGGILTPPKKLILPE
jgi:hypothetical protein